MRVKEIFLRNVQTLLQLIIYLKVSSYVVNFINLSSKILMYAFSFLLDYVKQL